MREKLESDSAELDKLFNETTIEYGQENTTIDSGEWYYITARQHDLIARQDAYIEGLESELRAMQYANSMTILGSLILFGVVCVFMIWRG